MIEDYINGSPTVIVERASRFEHGFKNIAISFRDFTDTDTRVIDERPAVMLANDDGDWGEQDDIANVAKAAHRSPPWVRALTMESDDGR